MLWAGRARSEHDAFVDALHEHDVTVHLFGALLAAALSTTDGRTFALDQTVTADHLGAGLAREVHALFADTDPATLAEYLIGGVTKADLSPLTRPSLTWQALGADDFVLAPLEALARRLFAAGQAHLVLVVEPPKGRSAMHLDTLLTMVDFATFVAYPYLDWDELRCWRLTPGDTPADLDVQESRGVPAALTQALDTDPVRLLSADAAPKRHRRHHARRQRTRPRSRRRPLLELPGTAPPATSDRKPLMTGSLLRDLDLDKRQVLDLLILATQLKRDKKRGVEIPRLERKSIVLVFEKNSAQTRCSFEVAAYDQGAQVTYLGPESCHLGREGSVADTARVLGGLFDGIAFRGNAQETVEQFAAHARTPVWNALTDEWHPTQSLADILTMIEYHGGGVEDIAFCFTGDGSSNVARSLLVTGAQLGMDVRIAAPAGLQPPADVVAAAEGAARLSGARLLVTDDLHTAVRGADFVYTDAWVSMDEPDDAWAARVPSLLPYRVTDDVLDASNQSGVRFMHCLPAIHNRDTAIGARLHKQFGLDGAEVTEEVFQSRRSIVFDHSENRMHTIKAMLVHALAD